jgi:hypothetical protein
VGAGVTTRDGASVEEAGAASLDSGDMGGSGELESLIPELLSVDGLEDFGRRRSVDVSGSVLTWGESECSTCCSCYAGCETESSFSEVRLPYVKS